MKKAKLRIFSLVIFWIFVCTVIVGMLDVADCAKAEPPGSERRVTVDPHNQINPVVSGYYIVWQDDRNYATSGWDI